MLQISDFSEDKNLADSEFLKKREAKILENLARERERLRLWLDERGMIPSKTKDRR